MQILVLSSSLDKNSRSRKLAKLCTQTLENLGVATTYVDLADLDIPNFDNDTIYQTDIYKNLHKITEESDGIVMCSPVYNWGLSAELKKYIEYVGSTPQDGSLRGALFDKVITFVNAGGVAESYTAFREIATALLLDFKCIINPYNVYAHDENWQDEQLIEYRLERIDKSMFVMMELCNLLSKRTYSSDWEI